jgi:hypothetical protein
LGNARNSKEKKGTLKKILFLIALVGYTGGKLLDALEEMDKLLETQNLLTLNDKEKENLELLRKMNY